jgi:hypothetical protein
VWWTGGEDGVEKGNSWRLGDDFKFREKLRQAKIGTWGSKGTKTNDDLSNHAYFAFQRPRNQ